MFAPLKKLNMDGSRFLDWRNKVASTGTCSVKCAAYDSEDSLVLLLANTSDDKVTAKVKLCANALLLRQTAQYGIVDLSSGESWTEDQARLFESGVELQIEANTCRFFKIDPAKN